MAAAAFGGHGHVAVRLDTRKHRVALHLGAGGGVDLVASPAMGGVVVGYELARQLGVPAIFTERVDGLSWKTL